MLAGNVVQRICTAQMRSAVDASTVSTVVASAKREGAPAPCSEAPLAHNRRRMTEGRLRPTVAVETDGAVVELPDPIARKLLDEHEPVNREHRKWRKRYGGDGRIIIIAPDVVRRARQLLKEADRDR